MNLPVVRPQPCRATSESRRPRGAGMYEGKLAFAQLIDHLPMHTFRRTVARYGGDHSVKCFTCQDQYRAMALDRKSVV